MPLRYNWLLFVLKIISKLTFGNEKANILNKKFNNILLNSNLQVRYNKITHKS